MWIKTKFEGDPIAAVKQVLSSHSTGKLVLDFSQGTVNSVEWCEKVNCPQKTLDTKSDNGVIVSA